jgi:hypothetical protein
MKTNNNNKLMKELAIMEDKKNAQNMVKVQELIAKSEEVRLGGELKTGVAIDYTTTAGNTYTGTVVFKRPTMLDYMKMGALKSEYLRLAGVVELSLVDISIKRIAQVMAVLGTVIVKSPEWLLNISNVVESDLLYHVHDKYEDWEKSFRKPSDTETSGDSSAT